jgi:hypothetical protein
VSNASNVNVAKLDVAQAKNLSREPERALGRLRNGPENTIFAVK